MIVPSTAVETMGLGGLMGSGAMLRQHQAKNAEKGSAP